MSIREKRLAAWKKIESKLQVADIILVRNHEMSSEIIKGITHSYWSHAMIVFFVPNGKTYFKNVLVIGAEDKGIEIHRIQKFSKNLSRWYDLGVKRVPGLSEEMRERVLSFMLNNVDIPYDYSRILAFFLNYLSNLFKNRKQRRHLKDFLVHKDAYICSSFIQKAFYEAVPKHMKDSVIFEKGKDAKFFMEEITPATLARSKNCQWIFNPHN